MTSRTDSNLLICPVNSKHWKPCSSLAPNDTMHLQSVNISSIFTLSLFKNLFLQNLGRQTDYDSDLLHVCVSCVFREPFVFMCCYAWPLACLWACAYVRNCIMNSPSHHYEEVQTVPCVSKVTLLAKYPQSHHLDHHLDGKKCEDEIIKVLQKKTHTEKSC